MSPRFSTLRFLEVSAPSALIQDILEMVQPSTLKTLSLKLVVSHCSESFEGENEAARVKILSILEGYDDTLEHLTLSDATGSSSRLSIRTFFRFLTASKLEHLDLQGVVIDDIDTTIDRFDAIGTPSKLKTLRISCLSSPSAVSLLYLRRLVENCPNLVSLQCGIKNLADVKRLAYDEAAKGLLNHKLRELVIEGTTAERLDPGQLLNVARYLDILFPDLEEVRHVDGGTSPWRFIGDMVEAFHLARRDNEARSRVIAKGEDIRS